MRVLPRGRSAASYLDPRLPRPAVNAAFDAEPIIGNARSLGLQLHLIEMTQDKVIWTILKARLYTYG